MNNKGWYALNERFQLFQSFITQPSSLLNDMSPEKSFEDDLPKPCWWTSVPDRSFPAKQGPGLLFISLLDCPSLLLASFRWIWDWFLEHLQRLMAGVVFKFYLWGPSVVGDKHWPSLITKQHHLYFDPPRMCFANAKVKQRV